MAEGHTEPVWAIITARGGSKRIRNKNLAPLAGHPLIWFTIEAASQSRLITECVVTSDDDSILEYAEACGTHILRRPKELASDRASSLDVIGHALTTLSEEGHEVRYFCLLQPTSPLRTSKDIDGALRVLFDTPSAGSVVSVTAASPHPYKTLVEDAGTMRPVRDWQDLSAPYQSLPKAFQQNGAIYAMSREVFEKERTLWVNPILYEMPKSRSMDIDDPIDLRVAEAIMHEQLEQ